MAIRNNGILLFSRRLSTYENLIWGLLHVLCIPLQVSFPHSTPPSLSHPSWIKATPQLQTCTGFCLQEELHDLQRLWSLKRQSYCLTFTFTLLMLKSEDTDLCQISNADRLKLQTCYADIWRKSAHMSVVSATQYFISGKTAETIVMREQTKEIIYSWCRKWPPFLSSLSYFSASAQQRRWLRQEIFCENAQMGNYPCKTSVKAGKNHGTKPK